MPLLCVEQNLDTSGNTVVEVSRDSWWCILDVMVCTVGKARPLSCVYLRGDVVSSPDRVRPDELVRVLIKGGTPDSVVFIVVNYVEGTLN
jgi:hypothetical protein